MTTATKNTEYIIKTSEALAIAIRLAWTQGAEVINVVPESGSANRSFPNLSESFILELSKPIYNHDIRNHTVGLPQYRLYWHEIVRIVNETDTV